MTERSYDVVIVGQGLAGTTLAWQLLLRGKSVLVLDAGEPITASRIAAGLITPLTGRKILPSWRYNLFFKTAVAFYRRVEQLTGSAFLQLQNHWRLFSDVKQQQAFEQRRQADTSLSQFLHIPSTPLNPDLFLLNHTTSSFEMQRAGQLLTGQYLETSRNYFAEQGNFLQTQLHSTEVDPMPGYIKVSRLGLQAKTLIFCQGAADRFNDWFPQIRFLPAKGEILTLKTAMPLQQILHAGLWLAPDATGDCLLAGATYDSRHLDQLPTEQGRLEISSRLDQILRISYSVVDHQAAVRPALHDQKPVLGLNRRFPSLGILNGLGSKGSLQAPWLAEHFADHLCTGKPLDAEIDLQRKYPRL